MRTLVLALSLLPLPGLAEIFTLPSRATEAVIYPQGALVTHDVRVTAPAGTHELVLPDLPQSVYLEGLRIVAPNMTLGTVRFREDFVPPRDPVQSEDIAAAEARIEQIRDQIQALRDDAARLKLAEGAADARVSFLTSLGDSDSLPADPEELARVAEMVSAQVLAAREAALDADIAARAVLGALPPLQEDLARAEAALAALVPEREDRAFVSVQVQLPEAVENAPLAVRYFTYDAQWRPAYDLRLSYGADPELRIARAAEVMQQTGENWERVRLTLSTQQPNDQIEPGLLPEDRRRLFEPGEILQSQTRGLTPTMMVESAADAEVFQGGAVAKAAAQGLTIIYAFPEAVDLASTADFVRVPFDELRFDAELVARVVPLTDDRAYLVARFTNDTGEPLLPAERAMRYFDTGLIGVGNLPRIDPGAEVELGFGAIDGLAVSRTVLERAEEDRGLMSRSNAQSEEVRIDLDNRTERMWRVELIDRVPYSEQEDLEITYTARPAPDVRGVEDRRGILQWNIPLNPSETATVTTRYDMQWPDGKVVR